MAAESLDFVIITGMSGAGKSYAIKCFEDMGFFCVDNLPTTLIPTFADLTSRSMQQIRRVALGVDVREGEYLSHLLDAIGELRRRRHTVEVLYLEASDETLVRRYHETRRRRHLAELSLTHRWVVSGLGVVVVSGLMLAAADLVLGQPDFTTNTALGTAAQNRTNKGGMRFPSGLAVDDAEILESGSQRLAAPAGRSAMVCSAPPFTW